LLLLVVFFLAAPPSFAQVSTSRIGGTVTDASGAVIPGAKVIATHAATGVSQETTTTESGAYSFASLNVGMYTITVEATGFKRWISTKNELNVGAPLIVNASLEVGEVTATIEVESSYERLKTTDAMISDVVDRRAIRDLPLNGRNPLNLITLQPGLIQRGSAARGSGTHINGSRDRAFNVTLDGIDANEPSVPNPQANTFRLNTDNVQEYRIVTHNATAEFGRSSGANIALASRSGSNEIHGNIFEYFRNPVLNAKDFFVNLQGGEKPDFKIHQFGADVGGPVLKNRTFWFFSWQSQRLGFTQPIQEVFGTPLVYTASARMGIYRFVRGTVNGRTSNGPALVDSSGNLLPGIQTCGGTVTTDCVDQYNIATNNPTAGSFPLDPVMMQYFGDMPLPNNFGSGDGLNTAAFTWNPPSSQPELRFLFRIDHNFNENNSIFGRFTWANADTKGGDFLNSRPQVFPGYPPLGLVDRRPRNLALSYRRVFSPRLVNELTVGFSRFLFDFLFGRANPDFPNIVPFSSPNVSEPFLAQSGTARWLTTVQYIDNISYTTGNHLFRGGFNIRFVRHNDERSFVGGVNNAPSVAFSSTRVPTSAFPNIPATGTGGINSADQTRLRNMMSDMLGLPASIAQSYFTSGLSDFTPSGLYIRGVRYHQYNFYGQDEWKLRPNFTLNLGLRWEWNRPAREANDLILRPDKALDGSAGLVTFQQRETFWDKQNAASIAPRIGIAWDPFSKGKSVIRLGYGVLFDVISTFQMVPVLGLVPGSSARCAIAISSAASGASVDAPSANCASPAGISSSISGGFPLSLPTPLAPPSAFTTPPVQRAGLAPPTGAIDRDLQNPTVHEWTLNVQHDLGKDVILQVGYLGKRGTHLFNAYDMNQVKLPSSFLSAFSAARNNIVIGCDADGTAAGSSTSPCTMPGVVVPTLLNQIVCSPSATTCSNVNGSTVTGRLMSNAAGSLADLLDTGATFSQSFNNMLAIPGVGADFFRPNPQFDLAFFFDNSADSYYHALQIQLRRQAANFGFGASYTFGKSIDTASTDPVGATSGGSVGNNSGTYTDVRNFAVDRGRSDFDRTHSFVGHVIYDLPFGRGQKYGAGVPAWLNQLVGGWTATSIVTITSGEPWSILSGQLTNSNIRGSRVDILQKPPTGVFHNISGVVGPTVFPESVLQNLDQYFAIPAPGSNGNSGRNIFTGPTYWNVDMGITKQFGITERINLQFRAEFFNAFNHTNFDNPLTSTDGSTAAFSANTTTLTFNQNFARTCCTSVTTPSTASLVSVGEAARVIQFALRLNF
jgi:hypothetical protein